jgi:ligand-binding sensor domain-containing protein
MKKLLFLSAILFANSAIAQVLTSYTDADGLLNNNTLCVDVDEADKVWFGTQGGVSTFDGDTWVNYTETDGLVDNTVFAIMVDSNGIMWAGTDFGISKMEDGNWTTYTTDDGLEDNRIKHIFEDSDGLIWFAHNDGVSSFDGATFTNYTMDDGLPFGGVSHVNQDATGTMWFGTGLGGCFLFDGSDFSSITDDDQLLSNAVRSIAVDGNNKKWVGTNTGISVFSSANEHLTDHESLIALPEPHEINPVEDVKIDGLGRVWAGVYVDYLVTVGGVAVYDGGVWSDFHESDGLAGPGVTQLAVTSDSDVWVSTSTGVTKISGVPITVEEQELVSLDIYPNPASGSATLVTNHLGEQLKVYTAQGQLVARVRMTSSQYTLDVSAWEPGIYLAQLGDRVEKLVVRP